MAPHGSETMNALHKEKARIFFARISKMPNGCWIWKGAILRGYGRFCAGKKFIYAHRFSYEHFKGPISKELTIDHLCRMPACVNPDHLEAVPIRINVLRGNTLPAKNKAKTHCLRGHPFDQENTYVTKKGKRHCRKCGVIIQKAVIVRRKKRNL